MTRTSARKIKGFNFSILLLFMGLATAMLPAHAGAAEDGTDDAKTRQVTMKRDPFWPVGYVPKQMVQEQKVKSPMTTTPTIVKSWDSAMKRVSINGVSRGSEDECFAIINGEVKAVGDQVVVRLGDTVYTWIVVNIQPPERVQLRRHSVQ